MEIIQWLTENNKENKIKHQFTIKRQIIIYMTFSTFAVSIITFLLTNYIIKEEFQRIAQNDINQKTIIIQKLLDLEISRLAGITADWGSWDDTYQFIIDNNQGYQQANLIPSSFITLDLSHIVYFDIKHNVVFAGAYDSITNSINDIDTCCINKLKKKLFNERHQLELIKGGLTIVNNTAYMVAGESIQTSQHQGPLRGWLCMIRPLNLNPLIQLTGLSLKLTVDNKSASIRQLPGYEPTVNSIYTIKDSIYADYYFPDLLNDSQIISLQLSDLNRIARQSNHTLFYILTVVLFFALVMSFFSLFGSNILILKPLKHISDQLASVNLNKINKTISLFKPSAEFHQLTVIINKMLETIAWQKDQIVQNEHHYRDLVENANVGILIDNSSGQVIYCNDMAAKLFGYDPAEFINLPMEKYIHPDDLKIIRQYHRRRMAGEDVPTRYEFRGWGKDGQCQDYEVNVVPLEKDGKIIGTRNYIFNITERKKFEKNLQFDAITDGLTGLLNRRGFYTQAQHQINLAHQTKKGFYLLYGDLNNLKQVNDKHGHEVGDLLIKNTAKILLGSFRKNDLVARVGGDEFIVLTPEAMPASIKIMIKRLQDNIIKFNENLRPDEKHYSISISIGYAYFHPETICSLEELMKRADEMMYQEKEKFKRTMINDRRLGDY